MPEPASTLTFSEIQHTVNIWTLTSISPKVPYYSLKKKSSVPEIYNNNLLNSILKQIPLRNVQTIYVEANVEANLRSIFWTNSGCSITGIIGIVILVLSQWGKNINSASIYLLKVSKRNARTRCEIFSKSTIKTPQRRHWHGSDVFIVNCEHISVLVLVFLSLTLDM